MARSIWICVVVLLPDEEKNEPLLGGHLNPELNLFDQILP